MSPPAWPARCFWPQKVSRLIAASVGSSVVAFEALMSPVVVTLLAEMGNEIYKRLL